MALRQNDQQSFRDYLLGKLGGEDLKSFEERLLTDKEDFEELLEATEDDLVDEYVCGQLSREERQAFETHYLITPERHEEIDFARSLDRYLEKQKQFTPTDAKQETYKVTPRPIPVNLTWILGGAMAIVVFGVIAYLIFPRQPSHVATITLNPTNVTRGNGTPDDRINLGNANTLRVFLTLPPQSTSTAQYRAELEDQNGNTRSLNVAIQDPQTVRVEIPANQLPKGQYRLKLLASQTANVQQRIATYSFTVE